MMFDIDDGDDNTFLKSSTDSIINFARYLSHLISLYGVVEYDRGSKQ